MRTPLGIAAAIIAALVSSAQAGVVHSKFGAKATVGDAYTAKFQAYIDDLESNGAVIRFMGGIRRGKCSSRHMHPCGRAIDICQLGRGRVDHRCKLPSRSVIAGIAARHGLFEGGQWCNNDYGHAQAGVSAAACGERTLAARSRNKHRTVALDANANYATPVDRLIAY